MLKRIKRITLIAMVMAVSGLGVLAGGKPGSTTTAAQETYHDTQYGSSLQTNIFGDETGNPTSTYVDGLQGVKCYIFPPTNSNGSGGSGDAILDTRYGAHRVLNFYFAPAPLDGTLGQLGPCAAVNSTNSTTEDVWVNIRQVNNVSNEQWGTASFSNSAGTFRFLGNTIGCNDCARSVGSINSSRVKIKRVDSASWEVWTVPGDDIAVRLVYKGGAGGGGLVPVGYYHLPFRMTITNLN